jgi:hypothetical protein
MPMPDTWTSKWGDDTWNLRKAGSCTDVQNAFQRALGYAWGHQDGTQVYDSPAASHFAHTYAEHVRRFYADEHHTHHNVAQAFRIYAEHRAIDTDTPAAA